MPNNKRALTLIELLIAMAISIVVSGVILAILVSSWRADIAQTAYLDLQQKSRTAVDEISSTIKVSSGVVTSHTAGGTTYTTSSTELVLKTPAIDDSLNILTGTDYYVFRRNPITATILERIIVADPASSRTTIASPVTLNDVTGALTFTYHDSAGATITPGVGDVTTSTAVKVVVDSRKTVQGRTLSRIIDNFVYLRNR